MTEGRTLRADAVRNRAQILAAARAQVSAVGPGVSMDHIAAVAGVAVGTLYRHYPTKADLIAAIVSEHITHLAEEAEAARERVEAGARALEEIARFLGLVVEESVTNHAVKEAARSLGADLTNTADEHRASVAVAALIAAAQADGDLRADITVDDIYLLFSTAPTDQPAPTRERWLALVLAGLANITTPP